MTKTERKREKRDRKKGKIPFTACFFPLSLLELLVISIASPSPPFFLLSPRSDPAHPDGTDARFHSRSARAAENAAGDRGRRQREPAIGRGDGDNDDDGVDDDDDDRRGLGTFLLRLRRSRRSSPRPPHLAHLHLRPFLRLRLLAHHRSAPERQGRRRGGLLLDRSGGGPLRALCRRGQSRGLRLRGHLGHERRRPQALPAGARGHAPEERVLLPEGAPGRPERVQAQPLRSGEGRDFEKSRSLSFFVFFSFSRRWRRQRGRLQGPGSGPGDGRHLPRLDDPADGPFTARRNDRPGARL